MVESNGMGGGTKRVCLCNDCRSIERMSSVQWSSEEGHHLVESFDFA